MHMYMRIIVLIDNPEIPHEVNKETYSKEAKNKVINASTYMENTKHLGEPWAVDMGMRSPLKMLSN